MTQTLRKSPARPYARIYFGFAAFLMLISAWQAAAFGAPSNPNPLLGKFRNTFYYTVLESDFAQDPLTTPLLDWDGALLVTVSSRFKSRLDMEGSG